MANTPQAEKRARQAEKHRMHNASLRSELRTQLKKVKNALAAQDYARAEQEYKSAQPLLDRMKSKGIIHINAAARHKSRLNAQIKKLKEAGAN